MQWDIGKPNPRQIEFFKARARFIAYGGARGGGKKLGGAQKAAGLALSYPGAGILIVRRTFPELRENHILPMTADLAGIARYRDADKSFTFPGGSRIVFGYCSSEATCCNTRAGVRCYFLWTRPRSSRSSSSPR